MFVLPEPLRSSSVWFAAAKVAEHWDFWSAAHPEETRKPSDTNQTPSPATKMNMAKMATAIDYIAVKSIEDPVAIDLDLFGDFVDARRAQLLAERGGDPVPLESILALRERTHETFFPMLDLWVELSRLDLIHSARMVDLATLPPDIRASFHNSFTGEISEDAWTAIAYRSVSYLVANEPGAFVEDKRNGAAFETVFENLVERRKEVGNPIWMAFEEIEIAGGEYLTQDDNRYGRTINE